MRFLWCLVPVLLLAQPVAGATIRGTAYDFGLEPLKGVIVNVNSTPQQSLVLADGAYSVELPRGTYLLTAAYYAAGAEAMSDLQVLTIVDDGEYTVDLILFPGLEEDELGDEFELDEITAPGTGGGDGLIGIVARRGPETDYAFLALAAALVGVIALLAYFILARKPKTKSGKGGGGGMAPRNKEGILPEDLDRVVSIIRESGGRMNQKDLRAKLPWSEAKVSLMVSDLEERGVVKRFKKGRGNIIRLEK